MLSNQGQAAEVVKILDPVSAAATVNATSGWVDVRKYEGDIIIVAQVGALTGTIAWTVEDATDGAGAGGAGFTGLLEGAFGAVTANNIQKRTIRARSTRGFIRIVGTIVTGPSLVAVKLLGHPKYTV